MKTSRTQNLIAAVLAMALLAPAGVLAQQVPLPKTAADVPGPAAGTLMTKEYVQMVGRMAYIWGYPIVNSHNRRAGFAYVTGQNGNVPGRNDGSTPIAPLGHKCDADRLHQARAKLRRLPQPGRRLTGAVTSLSTRSRSLFRCRISATVSGYTRCTMPGPTSLPRSASPTAPSRVST